MNCQLGKLWKHGSSLLPVQSLSESDSHNLEIGIFRTFPVLYNALEFSSVFENFQFHVL